MAILEVKDIKKSFGRTDVLKGIDFSVDKGEVVTILGPSGGGKTTLLRCLNFLETADNGQIIVDGKVLFDAVLQHGPADAGVCPLTVVPLVAVGEVLEPKRGRVLKARAL